jgi:hypothetical protein
MKTKTFLFSIILLSFLITRCDLFEPDEGVSLNLQLEKYTFAEGDTLIGTFTVKNLSSNTVHYKFSTSCQLGLKIISGDKTFRQYPELCAMVLTNLTLKGGESKDYEFELLLVDKDYNSLIKGDYTIEAFLLNNNSSIVSKPISIN